MKVFLLNIVWSVLAYLFGSIPWGLVIGKVFYKKDIRQYGSGNLGGTNAGRVLGKKAGITVILLDAFKAVILMALSQTVNPETTVLAGLFVAIGHCFPVFAQFRGGKGVACSVGYLLSLGIFGYADIVFIFVYPVLIFFLVLGITRTVSLSSMACILSAFAISLAVENASISVMLFILSGLVIYRHIPNIRRILQGKENKISWLR